MTPARAATALLLGFGLAGCVTGTDPVALPEGQIDAPGVDLEGEAVDGVAVGHRLLAAGEYELAIKSFNRAAVARGAIDAEILAGLGSANLGLGRLGQAETLLRRAVARDDAEPEDWNNLGVVLMEAGKLAEAELVFKRAFALDNGESVAIRDNLRLALAKSENSATNRVQTDDYKLVRRGSSDFLIRQTP
ncbi:tetratricopeptide repeat protein [uncultured Roseobacter sp.]|uniref:tetratricopeptide repeat protein n=1 Tax=uncultured Roseobacter sp. TaxID=114847 RepID=UPI002611ECE6|nr:tetratricopeptide repeat protein [uncultured Roseobacter sp.]